MGEEKHINKIPPKIPGQSRENFVYVFCFLCVFFFSFPINALNSEDRGLKVRFSLATIAIDRELSSILCQMPSSQGQNAPSNPYPRYLVRLATSRSNIAKSIPQANAFVKDLISENLLILLRHGPCLVLIYLSRNFPAVVFLQDEK